MNIAAIRRRCARLNGGAYDFPFSDDHRVYRVGGKIFAFVSERPPAIVSLKCDPGWTEVLRHNYPAITTGPYLNKRHWNQLVADGVPDELLRELIVHSYDLVFRSLTRAKREAVDQDKGASRKRAR